MSVVYEAAPRYRARPGIISDGATPHRDCFASSRGKAHRCVQFPGFRALVAHNLIRSQKAALVSRHWNCPPSESQGAYSSLRNIEPVPGCPQLEGR